MSCVGVSGEGGGRVELPCFLLPSPAVALALLILSRAFFSLLAACSWAGLGSQGRWGTTETSPENGNTWGKGLIWLCGEAWNSPPVYLHEMGHNVSTPELTDGDLIGLPRLQPETRTSLCPAEP